MIDSNAAIMVPLKLGWIYSLLLMVGEIAIPAINLGMAHSKR
jgi:hypothetical protein